MIFKFIKKVLKDLGKTIGDMLLGFGCAILFVAAGMGFFVAIGFLFQWIPGVHVFFPEGKPRITGYITVGFIMTVIPVLGWGAISYLKTTWKDMKRK